MNGYFHFIKKSEWNISFFIFIFIFLCSVSLYVGATEDGNGKNFFQDRDQDGLSDDEERVYRTDPDNPDTDGDGYSDGVEIESGYDPLKPAPGDRIVPESYEVEEVPSANTNNLTKQTSLVLVDIVQDAAGNSGAQKEISIEDIDAALSKALSSNDEIVLPEIDLKSIKIKKIPSRLKGDERKERERKDVTEYLTLMGFVMMNNSPLPVKGEDEVTTVIKKIGEDSFAALLTGDTRFLDTVERQGKKFLEQIRDIEVPESMLEIHVKGLKLGQYASELKSRMDTVKNDDPLRQVGAIGEMQALFTETQMFISELESKFAEYEIVKFSEAL